MTSRYAFLARSLSSTSKTGTLVKESRASQAPFQSHLQAATTRLRKNRDANSIETTQLAPDEKVKTTIDNVEITRGLPEARRKAATSEVRSQSRTRSYTDKSVAASLSATEVFRAKRAKLKEMGESVTFEESKAKPASNKQDEEKASLFSWIPFFGRS